MARMARRTVNQTFQFMSEDWKPRIGYRFFLCALWIYNSLYISIDLDADDGGRVDAVGRARVFLDFVSCDSIFFHCEGQIAPCLRIYLGDYGRRACLHILCRLPILCS